VEEATSNYYNSCKNRIHRTENHANNGEKLQNTNVTKKHSPHTKEFPETLKTNVSVKPSLAPSMRELRKLTKQPFPIFCWPLFLIMRIQQMKLPNWAGYLDQLSKPYEQCPCISCISCLKETTNLQ
jgi:hypothetical protein